MRHGIMHETLVCTHSLRVKESNLWGPVEQKKKILHHQNDGHWERPMEDIYHCVGTS